MRNEFADVFYELAKVDKRLAMVVADISPAGSMMKFREEYPMRFVNTGVAEQIMIGMVAGMALRGMRPFAYTIATFALYRPFEFIRDDICYQNLPITVVGVGGGVTYSTLGATHHAMEDVAVASSIPGMTVIAPCDPLETRAATKWCATQEQGPVYLRLGKTGEQNFTENCVEPFVLGKLRTIRGGEDVCILVYGPIVSMAFELADKIETTSNRTVAIMSCHTLKPIDKEGIADTLKQYETVYVIEEHVPHGGLSSRVKEIAFDTKASCDLRCYTLQDKFIHLYGAHEQLQAAHGLAVEYMI